MTLPCSESIPCEEFSPKDEARVEVIELAYRAELKPAPSSMG